MPALATPVGNARLPHPQVHPPPQIHPRLHPSAGAQVRASGGKVASDQRASAAGNAKEAPHDCDTHRFTDQHEPGLHEIRRGSMNAIEAQGLRREFPGGVVAVDGIDLEVRYGEIFGVLGPNGAGKTTTVRPTAGRATGGCLDLYRGTAGDRPPHRRRPSGGRLRSGRDRSGAAGRAGAALRDELARRKATGAGAAAARGSGRSRRSSHQDVLRGHETSA